MLDDGHIFIIFLTCSFGFICLSILRKLRFGLNFCGNFWFFLRFDRLILLRVRLFFVLIVFSVLRSLIFLLKLLRIIFYFLWCSTLWRIIKSFWRRFIKPRFFVQFFKKPIFSFKNTLCKLPCTLVNRLFCKRIPEALANFAPLVPDSYVVINCNCIFFLFVDVVQMHKTESRFPFVVTGFFLKIYAWFLVLTKEARNVIFTATILNLPGDNAFNLFFFVFWCLFTKTFADQVGVMPYFYFNIIWIRVANFKAFTKFLVKI